MDERLRHAWRVSPAEAREIQNRLRSKVRRRNSARINSIRYVAGVDVSVRDGRTIAAVPVLDFDELKIVDLACAEQATSFPYVPGLLSFREIPSILEAVTQLSTRPDLFLVDGQGIAHPRRFGLASHLGVLLGLPTIGCAKSRYIGVYEQPHEEAGSYVDLIDDGRLSRRPGELLGAVLRTRTSVKPIFVSIGHQVDLATAVDLVWHCCAGFRLPEPTRAAHRAAANFSTERP